MNHTTWCTCLLTALVAEFLGDRIASNQATVRMHNDNDIFSILFDQGLERFSHGARVISQCTRRKVCIAWIATRKLGMNGWVSFLFQALYESLIDQRKLE